jgi:atypical dual specificity phosphatase
MPPWQGPAPPFYPDATQTALDRCVISNILPRLYLTNFKGADNQTELEKIGCTHIAAIGEEFVDDPARKGIKFYRQDISDDESQGSKMSKSLRAAAAFVHEGMSKKKGVVVVHCAAGVSRSTTVVLGYLVIYKKMTVRDAFGHVYERRKCVWPNDAFMSALLALEKQVRKGKAPSLTLEEYTRWGDWDGPEEVATEVAAGSSSPRPRPMLGRLKRDDTCLEIEKRQLDLIAAMSKKEARASIMIQRVWRQWRDARTAAAAASKVAGAEAVEPSQLRRGSSGLSRQRRKRASIQAAEEARMSRNATRAESMKDVSTRRPPPAVHRTASMNAAFLVRRASSQIGASLKKLLSFSSPGVSPGVSPRSPPVRLSHRVGSGRVAPSS